MYQAPGNLNEDIKRLAEMKDVLLRMDYSAPESPAIRISTYEKNAGKYPPIKSALFSLN